MTAGSIFLAAFLAAGVEWVEAFTIVLAVALSIGWRRAASAALAALALLAAMTAATGGLLDLWLDGAWLEGAIGVLLLLFGVRWLAKAIARHAGLRALRDEDLELAAATRELARADRHAAWLVAFKGVLLEGLEVVFIVLTFGSAQGSIWLAAAGAAAALVLVAGVGVAVRAPLARVPENAMKFAVGLMLTTFGVFWSAEGAGADWPGSDAAILGVLGFVALSSFVLVRLLRRERRTQLRTAEVRA